MNKKKELSAFEQASLDRMKRQEMRSVYKLDRKLGETPTQRDTRVARELRAAEAFKRQLIK
jgi:hypothetical protein